MLDTTWIPDMAACLVDEIAEQMGGIRLTAIPSPGDTSGRQMDGVHAKITGEHSIDVCFCAERNFFVRFTRNMLEKEPDEEEVSLYGTEFFNVLCGRFIAEAFHRSGIKITLLPVEYEWNHSYSVGSAANTVNFVSDAQEYASFSWTPLPVEDKVRRNVSNG